METETNNEINEIKKLRKRQANKKYYDTNKQSINEYIVNYINNRRHNDDDYKQRINIYYKNKYDDEARQKKKDYYLKRKQNYKVDKQ